MNSGRSSGRPVLLADRNSWIDFELSRAQQLKTVLTDSSEDLRSWSSATPALFTTPATELKTAIKNRTRFEFVLPVWSDREHTKARFRRLRYLGDDHDGQGAAAPSDESIDEAIAFISRSIFPETPMATVDDDGMAVLELTGPKEGFFGDITFYVDEDSEISLICYAKPKNDKSLMCQGKLRDRKVQSFLRESLDVAYE